MTEANESKEELSNYAYSKKDRSWIHTVARFSNWSEGEVSKSLGDNEIYADKTAWAKFVELALLGLGGGFLASGIMFFFAFNWDAIDKFYKIGMAQGALVVTIGAFLFVKSNHLLKQMLLTLAAAIVGVLFALLGQIYQTGANMYDFFLAWSAFITLWVLLVRYPVLWLLYMVLINTTLILYANQVASDWQSSYVFGICFVLNAAILTFWEVWKHKKDANVFPNWFFKVLALATSVFLVMSAISALFDRDGVGFLIMIPGAIWSFLAIGFGIYKKEVFYVSLLPFCGIIIATALITKVAVESHVEGIVILFSLGAFVIAAVSILIRKIIHLNKNWNANGK